MFESTTGSKKTDISSQCSIRSMVLPDGSAEACLIWCDFTFWKGCLKNTSHQHMFSCRIPYMFLVTKASSWEVTSRISHGLWELACEQSNLPHVRPFSSGSYSLADHEVHRFVTWPLPFLFLLTLCRFKQVWAQETEADLLQTQEAARKGVNQLISCRLGGTYWWGILFLQRF